jgi:hypothetical protein
MVPTKERLRLRQIQLHTPKKNSGFPRLTSMRSTIGKSNRLSQNYLSCFTASLHPVITLLHVTETSGVFLEDDVWWLSNRLHACLLPTKGQGVAHTAHRSFTFAPHIRHPVLRCRCLAGVLLNSGLQVRRKWIIERPFYSLLCLFPCSRDWHWS